MSAGWGLWFGTTDVQRSCRRDQRVRLDKARRQQLWVASEPLSERPRGREGPSMAG